MVQCVQVFGVVVVVVVVVVALSLLGMQSE
jgi:hypothetical protein